MLFEKVIKMGSGFVPQSGGNFQNGQVGIGKQLFGVRKLNTTPIRNN